ncbi:MAG: hypothetical protein AAB641_01675 [Patescibacteria group bacterium]
MKKLFLLLLFLSCVSVANAQELEQGFTGPGGCTGKVECRAYCDIDANKEECLTFAVDNGMMTQEEADRARKFLNETGPGGCKGEECRTYCDEVSHHEECLNFAVEKGFISREEAERMRKFRAIEEEGGPGGCKGEECRTYCEDESRREECFKFAKDKGLIDEEEVELFEQGQKILEKVKESGGPGGCRGEEECRQYCSDASNTEECVTFGAMHTGKSPEEIRRMLDEFKNFKDRRGEFEDRREEFEERARRMREEFENRAREKEGQFEERRNEYEEKFRREFPGQGEFPGQKEFPGQYNFPPEGERMPYDNFRPENQTQYQDQYQNTPPEGYPKPESYQQYQQNYQSPTTEPQPTTYDHSRSFLANILSAFLAPFRD